MVCPYRVVMGVVTVVMAVVLSSSAMGDAPPHPMPSDLSKAGSCPMLKRKSRTLMYRLAYAFAVACLLLFHFELFSGGAICKALFAPAAAAATSTSPPVSA
eukprot:m.21221 g.21221  ORF g.21221 m.21221 type:complete len:101 (+) comp6361_c0_seq1:396-698(+)